jgi:branched-chain amino acid transport system substrate-binding protein
MTIGGITTQNLGKDRVSWEEDMLKRIHVAFLAMLVCAISSARAEDTIKIGFIAPSTGQFAQIGSMMIAGAKYFIAANGADVVGKKIELLIKDDGSQPDNAKRIAQELIVNDKVAVLAGFTFTPVALAVAPLATEAKVPEVVMAAGTSIITEKSPYIARTFYTIAQTAEPMAQWAADNGLKKIVTLVSDYAPGYDAENAFGAEFKKRGGEIVANIRVPVQSPDFAPFLQRARDANPDGIFVFIPGSMAGTFARQYAERGLNTSAMKLMGTLDMTDDDLLPAMGDAAIGTITAGPYSVAHASAENQAFVAGFTKFAGKRPNHVAESVYDGMRLIYEALKKTNGDTDGDKLIAAMKGISFEGPRGPITIDPRTRDIVHNIYIRRVERRDGELYNVEFATYEAVKDPIKEATK